MHRLLHLASGLLLTFFAFGAAAWFSGAASWIAYYCGATGAGLVAVAQYSVAVGFAAAVIGSLLWIIRFRRRASAALISPGLALIACLALPFGNIFWAIFVDAVAYHYGEDIVRPAFDMTLMYIVLGCLPPLAVGVPFLMQRAAVRQAA